MPLIPPTGLLPVSEVGPVHFIAAGGAGMSGVAAMYAELGVTVSGSDQADSGTLRDLTRRGVTTFVGHQVENLGRARTVVVSTAVRETNPELAAARARGLRIWHRSAALAALMLDRAGVAVTGTHGKTTTSAMAAVLLAGAGADPSYVVGAPLADTGTSFHHGRGEAFVIEADESDGSFLQYPARIVVVTNIEADHLDNWGTAQAYADGFLARATAPGTEVVIAGADDAGSRDLARKVRAAGVRVVTVGESPEADVRLSELRFVGRTATARLSAAADEGDLELAVPGRYNLLNAAAAYAVGRELGLPGEQLRAAARSFHGTHRRFQTVAEVGGIRIVDDYAHHPTEVRATLAAARVAAGHGRVIACFQPHLFTRTRDFAAEFGEALATADEVVVLGIYPAREDPIPGVSGAWVAQALAARASAPPVHYREHLSQAPELLAGIARPGDLVLTLGAGDITTLGPMLAATLVERAGG